MTDNSIACWVCTDCIMLFANGEDPPEATEEEIAAWRAAIDAGIPDGHHIACGGTHEDYCPNIEWVCGDCHASLIDEDQANDDECPTTGRAWHRPAYGAWIGSSDCDCETIDFSWRPCDTCQNALPGGGAGTRHAVTLFPVAQVSS